MFDVYHVVLWIFVGVLDNIDPQKDSGVKINDRYNDFSLLNENILTIQTVLYFFYMLYCTSTKYFLNAVCKRILNLYKIPYIYDSYFTLLSVHQDLQKLVIPCKEWFLTK